MPEYKSRKSQSYKKSKNSKNGGRRRKHTMRKYRRGKKVMRGGAKEISAENLARQLNSDEVMTQFLEIYFDFKSQDVTDVLKIPGFDDFVNDYNNKFNKSEGNTYINSDELMQSLHLKNGEKYYDDPKTNKLKMSILSLAV